MKHKAEIRKKSYERKGRFNLSKKNRERKFVEEDKTGQDCALYEERRNNIKKDNSSPKKWKGKDETLLFIISCFCDCDYLC